MSRRKETTTVWWCDPITAAAIEHEDLEQLQLVFNGRLTIFRDNHGGISISTDNPTDQARLDQMMEHCLTMQRRTVHTSTVAA